MANVFNLGDLDSEDISTDVENTVKNALEISNSFL